MLGSLETHGRLIVIFWLLILLIAEYCIANTLNLKLINAKNRLLKNISLGIIVKFLLPLLSVFVVTYISQYYLYIPIKSLWMIIIDLLCLDLVLYFFHVLAHKNIILWKFHEIHHLDERLDATTGFRIHFGEALLSLVCM